MNIATHLFSRLAQTFFDENGVNWWHTPPESPDCNPIENLWHEVKVCLTLSFLLIINKLTSKEFLRREVKPRTKQELLDGIESFWLTVDVEKCQKYIHHLRKVTFLSL